jgi:aminoacrylate hydrolase
MLPLRRRGALPAYLTHELAKTIPGARVHEVEWGARAYNVVTADVFNRTLLDFCAEVDR